MTTYKIIINSGLSSAITYQTRSNISTFQVTNSDNEYYQNGFIELFNVSNQHNIGDTVDIYINDNREFRGYISRREQTIDRGTKVIRYQLIGETYDLWRYHTDDYAIYSGMTTYIASSLVSSYCEGISGNFSITGGVNLVNDIDLTNMTVGDAIARLTKLDGYRFYVRDGYLNYYKPNLSTNASFTITDSDIISMEPVEEADEDIVNDVLVIGGSDYSAKTIQKMHPSSTVFPSGFLVAQQFKAIEPRLSAVKLYLGRSEDPNQPDQLAFEIWDNTEKKLFTDDFTNYNYLKEASGYNISSGSWPKFNSSSSDKFGSFLRLGISSSSLLEVTPSPPYDTPKGCKMLAQVFKCTSNASVYWAYMPSTILYDDTYDYHRYLITPTGSTGAPDLNNILGSSQFNSFSWNETKYYFPKTPRLESGNKYALVLVSKDYPTEPDTYCYDAWVSSGIYGDNGKYYVNLGGSNWAGTSATTPFKIQFIKFYTSGLIESKTYTEDCRYIKIDLENVYSSNHIFISGTNDSGSTWKELQNNLWIDFGSEDNSGTIIRYKMSSNGYFTPKIDLANLRISDESGGFVTLIWSDEFDDDSNISYQHSTQIVSGRLVISANSDLTYYYPSKATNISITDNPGWNDYSQCYDKDENTYTYSNDTNWTDGNVYTTDEYVFSTSICLHSYWVKAGESLDGNSPTNRDWHCYLDKIYISGEYTNGWVLWRDSWNLLESNTGFHPGPFTGSGYHTDIKKVRVKLGAGAAGSHKYKFILYETKARIFKKITYNGNISSNTFTSIYDVCYLKPVLSGDKLNYITISGSADSGATWVKLYNNTKTKVANPGKYIKINIYLKPWSGSSNFYPNSPRLNSIQVYGYSVRGGGLPKYGSKIEWSDDISWNANDVPYQPSWSSWKQYSEPKLQLTSGNYYWMVFEYPSSNGKWWSYYYDSSSTYDGRIMYSQDGGVHWSGHIHWPTKVPPGNMAFQLGWKEGQIIASAQNLTSIDLYGRHFKKITDNTITTLEEAQARADYEVSGSETIPKKGTITIVGRTNISPSTYFSANLSNFGINEKFSIRSYTHSIDKNGFLTSINYGKHPFDYVKKLADLEREVS